MKIIHTSDWHFGMRVGTGNYQDCQEYFLEQLYKLIQKEEVGAVLCAGDVYDSGSVGADAITLFDRAAREICATYGVKFIVIAGNHDSPERLAAHHELLKQAGLYISGRIERDIQPVLLDHDRVAVYPVPYFNQYEVAALFPEFQNEIHSQQDAAMVLCNHIRETMNPSRRNILMGHSFVVGAELSESDRAAQVGLSSAVSHEVFHGFDYVALGHIHKPQTIRGQICYSGSPIKYSFGKEETQTKGVMLIDTDEMNSTFVPLPLLRDRKSAEGTLKELLSRQDLQNAYLRLKVTDRFAGLETQAVLQEQFPYLSELVGMQVEDSGEESTLTVGELEKLDDAEIMIKFLQERYHYTPTEEQILLFRNALLEAEEE